MTEQAVPQKFHIGTVLSITTDYLLHRPKHGGYPMEGVYEILNYMTGDSLFTHQLPRAAKEVRPEINKQLPWTVSVACVEMCNDLGTRLAECHDQGFTLLGGDKMTLTQFIDWFVNDMAKQFGEYHELTPVPFSVEHKDAIEELQEMVSPEKIIVLSTGEDQ